MAIMGTDLAIRRSPKVALVSGVLVLVAALMLVAWNANNPQPLPTSNQQIPASTPVGAAIYVGVFQGGSGFTRSLHLSGVKVHTTSNTAVQVTPLLCLGGAIGVTTDPEAYCDDLINPEGQVFTSDDSIILEVTSDEPAVAVIDPVRLGFREHFQWGTMPAGAGAVVRVVAD